MQKTLPRCFVHQGIKLTDAAGYCDDINLERAERDQFMNIEQSDQTEVVIEKYDNRNANHRYMFILVRKQSNGVKFDTALVNFKLNTFTSNSKSDYDPTWDESDVINSCRYVAYTQLKNHNIVNIDPYFPQTAN